MCTSYKKKSRDNDFQVTVKGNNIIKVEVGQEATLEALPIEEIGAGVLVMIKRDEIGVDQKTEDIDEKKKNIMIVEKDMYNF